MYYHRFNFICFVTGKRQICSRKGCKLIETKIYSDEAFAQLIKPGTAVVLDDVEEMDIGSIGSYNILAWQRSGAVGVVTDGCSRDTDEIAIERVPLYLRKKGRGIRPGRKELYEILNIPMDKTVK